MKFFIDSADIDEIRSAFELGIMDGVTTNPSLIKKASEKHQTRNMAEYIKQIFLIVGDKPVSLEVKGGNADEMYFQARRLYDTFKTQDNTVVIKIPISPSLSDEDGLFIEGLKVIKKLSDEGVPTNVTLIFTPEQALLAAKAGATYVSPFVGREDDFIRSQSSTDFDKNAYYEPECDDESCANDNGIHSGLELVEEIVDIFEMYEIKTQVLAASLRNTRQVREAALLGADVSTIPYDVIAKLVKHQKTIEGMQKFTDDFVAEYEDLLR